MNLLARLITGFDASLVALAYWLIALLCASILIVGHVNPPIPAARLVHPSRPHPRPHHAGPERRTPHMTAELNRDAMVAELRRDEGVVPSAYQDHLGYWTIGVGRLIDKRKGGRLTDDEIDYLLNNDINRFMAELDRKLPWWRTLDAVRQRVILNMAFNLGVEGLLGFKNTLTAVQQSRWSDASKGMLASKWAKQVGLRADRLAKMMRTGAA